MNNRNFLLFTFSLMALSCSAMETDNENGNFLDFLTQATCSNPHKQEFLQLTNETFKITKSLQSLLENRTRLISSKDITENATSIENTIKNELLPNTENIMKILGDTSINEKDSKRLANLSNVSNNKFLNPEKITPTKIKKLNELILETRIVSLDPNNDALVENSGISYSTEFSKELEKLKAERQMNGTVSIDTLKDYQSAAEKYLTTITEQELQADITLVIEDTKKLISSKQKTLPPTKKSNSPINRKDTDRIDDRDQKFNQAFQQNRKTRLLEITALLDTFWPKDDIKYDKLYCEVVALNKLKKLNPEDKEIKDLHEKAVVLLIDNTFLADEKLKFIEYLPEDHTFRTDMRNQTIAESTRIKEQCLSDLKNTCHSLRNDANYLKSLLAEDKKIVQAKAEEYEQEVHQKEQNERIEQEQIKTFLEKLSLDNYKENQLLSDKEHNCWQQISGQLQTQHPNNRDIILEYNIAFRQLCQTELSADQILTLLNECFPGKNIFKTEVHEYIINKSATWREIYLSFLENNPTQTVSNYSDLLEQDKKIVQAKTKEKEQLDLIKNYIRAQKSNISITDVTKLYEHITTLDNLLAKEKTNRTATPNLLISSLLRNAITMLVMQESISADKKLKTIDELSLQKDNIIYTDACEKINEKSTTDKDFLLEFIKKYGNNVMISENSLLHVLEQDRKMIKTALSEQEQKKAQTRATYKKIFGGITLATILAAILYNYDKLPNLKEPFNNFLSSIYNLNFAL